MKKNDDDIPAWFRGAFRQLVVIYQPRTLDPETMAVYYAVLQELGEAAVLEAAENLKRAGDTKYFPSGKDWYAAAVTISRRLRLEAQTKSRAEYIDPTDPPLDGESVREKVALLRAAMAGDDNAASQFIRAMQAPLKPDKSRAVAYDMLAQEAARRGVTVDELRELLNADK